MSEADVKIDRADSLILNALRSDGRLSSQELAERVSLTASPCWRRVKRLEEAGVIRGYHADIDPRRLGYHVMAFAQVALEKKDAAHIRAFEDAVRASPEILACHCISGRYDHQLTVIARTLDSFGDFIRLKIGTLPNVQEIHTSLVLKEVKALAHAAIEIA